MKKIIVCTFVFTLLISIIATANSNDKKIVRIIKTNPKLLTSIKLGTGPSELPNIEGEADFNYSPRYFFMDSEKNYYFFIHGFNVIKKMSCSGKLIKNINLDQYATYIDMIFFDESCNKIYALSSFKQ